MNNCYEVEIHFPDGHRRKNTVWAESYKDVEKILKKEVGKEKGHSFKIRIT